MRHQPGGRSNTSIVLSDRFPVTSEGKSAFACYNACFFFNTKHTFSHKSLALMADQGVSADSDAILSPELVPAATLTCRYADVSSLRRVKLR